MYSQPNQLLQMTRNIAVKIQTYDYTIIYYCSDFRIENNFNIIEIENFQENVYSRDETLSSEQMDGITTHAHTRTQNILNY